MQKTTELGDQILPDQEQWCVLESNRLLLEPRKLVISTIFRLIATAALLVNVPLGLIATWVTLAFGMGFWMKRLISAYSVSLRRQANTNLMSASMTRIVQRYKTAWLINCVVWGLLSLLSQIWLPDAARTICVAVLNALMFLSITRTSVDRVLMHRVSAILIVSQLIASLVRYSINSANPSAFPQLFAYTFYLLMTWYLLWLVGNRFNQIHTQRLNFEYSKLQLIENLSKSQHQLHVEQQALTAANTLVQQFYSGAAHDLRQPVYAMQLYTEMLCDDPTQAAILLPKISQSCSSINTMFNTLFDYQQIHMDDAHLLEKEVNIAETFKNLALHFQPIASAKGLDIRFRSIEGSVTMKPLYLIRILSNLIANAIRYTSKGGVLVGVRKTRTHLSFEIWDTGIGIEDNIKQSIFNEFFKVNKMELENDGLGLGLAIVKQLTTRIDEADISVHSFVGNGSVFKFRLPLQFYVKA
jgi:signal transduction histidine kinase